MTNEPYIVSFHSIKRPGTMNETSYATMAEAMTVCAILFDQGKYPTIFYRDGAADFRCGLMCANKWSTRPVVEWWFGFTPNGCFKSIAARYAEDAGVRYRSHRAGYRASRKAMTRFAADWDAYLASGIRDLNRAAA